MKAFDHDALMRASYNKPGYLMAYADYQRSTWEVDASNSLFLVFEN